jgi:hypothetical protein
VFEALKAFQKDHGLSATGMAKPDDETIKALNKEPEQQLSLPTPYHRKKESRHPYLKSLGESC